jgi:hypothetical protein
MDTTLLDCLYEELINLDEQAGCFDEETNRFIDTQRSKLFNQIVELEQSAQN